MDKAGSLDFGSKEAARLLDPASQGDKLLAAMVALIQLKNTGEDAQTVASKYLSPKVVMHADPAGAFYAQDKVGVDAFMKAPQQYGSTYSFSRHLIASAKTTPKDNWAFAWWFDEGVEVTEAWRDKVPHPDARSNIMGLWAVKGDDEGRIKDLWFFRQLTPQERALRFKDHKAAMPFQDFDARVFSEPSELAEDSQRAAAMMEAAQRFDCMYKQGSTQGAGEVLADNVTSYDLLFGSSSNSLQEWVDKHDKLFAGETYSQDLHTSTIAVTAHSNKAFIHWEYVGPQGHQGGMNVLVFDLHTLKVTHVLGFRTPSPGEACAVLKDQPIDLKGMH